MSGLTLPRFTLLRCLYFAGKERLTLTEIGRQLAVTPGNVTQLVDALERDGLVERVSSEADRRVTYAALTHRGEELCKDLVPHVVEMMHDHTSDLTDEERSMLTALLKRIRASLFERD